MNNMIARCVENSLNLFSFSFLFFNVWHHKILVLQLEWSQPQTLGDLVNPRAGHAGIAIDGNWYIVGGGDNRTGR